MARPVDRVLGALVPRAVGALDPDELLERIDVDALLQRMDVDALVAQIDVDALIGRVDVDAIVARVDVDALMARVDVDALVGRVDIAALVARAGIDQIVADATTGLAARSLALAQRQIAAIDAALLAGVDRVLRRPTGPPGPLGRPAGPLARLLAVVVDSAVVSATFSLGVLLIGTLFGLFTGTRFDIVDDGGPGWAAAFAAWWFTYLWLGVAVAGRTVGKGLIGLRVVDRNGGAVPSRRAAMRAIFLPVSLIAGLGLLPGLLGRQRRALHDLVAGTLVLVHDGDVGAAEAVPTSPVD